MESSNIFHLLLYFVLALRIPELTSAQFTFRHGWCGDATYAPNSTYQSNLRAVLNSLATDTRITYGFYNFTAGQGPDRVNSLVVCRGDVPLGTCRVCVRDSASLIPQTCPNQKEAFGYSQNCKIFISNRAIYGIVQNERQWYLTTSENVTGVIGFNQTLYSLMSSLQNRAASGNSELKYATGGASLTGGGGQKLYGLVQCTPDLSRLACIQCIQGSLSILPTCCIQPSYTASGVTIVIPSCFVQYELFNFTGNVPNLTPPPLPPSPGPPSPPSNNNSTSTAVKRRKKSLNPSVIAVPIVVATTMIIAVVLCITLRKKKLRKAWMLKFNKDEIETLQSLQFSLGTIKHATGDFSEVNKLGEGGFGVVYKFQGVFSNGQELAVKRLTKNSAHGDLQFKNEILILAKLQHKNLVRLLGFCLQEEEMLLIYEFIANRSLDYFIFDPVQRETMRWETCYKIIYGIARGLLYLHEESRTRIIYRDLKAGNVLLDEEFNPKIADFGMARLFNIDQSQTLASRIVGTYGYMSPEYVLHGQVSMKSDVFSFGVLILEIVSGQMISSFLNGEKPENLLSYAWKNWVDGTPWNVVDTTLSAGFSTDILRCIHIGLLCVQENLVDRPTMSSIDLMLSRQSLSLQRPLQPAFFIESISQSNGRPQENTTTESSSRTRRNSVNEVTITEPYPR
ncbi:putative receptor-like protein kinase At4g00960 [Chenopodium quinoa]|uniref:putative receptor-like protein kinase At4g00960 n=1 Tax=Chenopodium quinoa TaxID=63459 RepID=UPI000B78CF2D|nr:putative receptor-like protein kinase At4g00960 [Chenopodium quinoa]